jgi:hypothetical protein
MRGEKMFKLYSRIADHETILECWASSTKHPDARFFFSEFEKSKYFDEDAYIVPWIYECASKMMWPYHAFKLAEWGSSLYRVSSS